MWRAISKTNVASPPELPDEFLINQTWYEAMKMEDMLNMKLPWLQYTLLLKSVGSVRWKKYFMLLKAAVIWSEMQQNSNIVK